MIKRHLEIALRDHLFKDKTVVLYGARQVGKTTLINEVVKKLDKRTLVLNGDDADIRALFENATASGFRPVVSGYGIVIIDEAQRIQNAGLGIKIIHDNFNDIQLIVTGSSSLELAAIIKEPLTGRKHEFFLYPFSFRELADHSGFLEEKRDLEQRLIFGSYPDVVNNRGRETRILKELASSYLYKDILAIGGIKKPVLLEKILKALALQVGNEVSYNELAQTCGSDKGTVEKYIDLLEKAYIVFRLPGLNRNVRSEIKKGKKIYFCDNGIRNVILGNFLPLRSRVDAGALWENYLVSERIKLTVNLDERPVSYFWRTTQQQEIDYIEEISGEFIAYEFKWNPSKRGSLSKTFANSYRVKSFSVVTPENYHEFLSEISGL